MVRCALLLVLVLLCPIERRTERVPRCCNNGVPQRDKNNRFQYNVERDFDLSIYHGSTSVVLKNAFVPSFSWREPRELVSNSSYVWCCFRSGTAPNASPSPAHVFELEEMGHTWVGPPSNVLIPAVPPPKTPTNPHKQWEGFCPTNREATGSAQHHSFGSAHGTRPIPILPGRCDAWAGGKRMEPRDVTEQSQVLRDVTSVSTSSFQRFSGFQRWCKDMSPPTFGVARTWAPRSKTSLGICAVITATSLF